jgi:uncharacterized protein (TIGR00369 family)
MSIPDGDTSERIIIEARSVSEIAVDGHVRTRTINWEDPVLSAEQGFGMTPMERMRRFADGEEPQAPLALALDMSLTEFGDGHAVIILHPGEFHYDLTGCVQSGVIAAMLDAVMGAVIQTRLPAKVGMATLEVNVSMIRPIMQGTGAIRAEGSITHLGSRVASAEAEVFDQAGTLHARSTGTFFLMRP